MKDSLFVCLYLLSNIFRTFNIYLFFDSFLGISKEMGSKKIGYVAYFLVISAEYILMDIPILTLILNVIGLLALTFFYETNMKRRILGAGFILALLCAAEAVVMILTGYLSFSYTAPGFYSSYAGVVCIPIVSFMFVLLYRKIKRQDRDSAVPLSYWIMVIVVPIACIYMVLLGFSFGNLAMWQMLSIVIVMFGITVSVFLLYEKQIEFFREENRKRVLEVQNLYYQKQIDDMAKMENAQRSLRHDMKNHLLTIGTLAEESDNVAIKRYVEELYENSRPIEAYFSTGNRTIDSMLSNKIKVAEGKGLSVDVNVVIPETLNLNDRDCTVLLGNLLDNAIENAKDNITLTLRYDKGRLIICCKNPYVGTLRRRGESYFTSKSDKKNHGLGFQNMNNIVQKYDGEMVINDADNVFEIEILLYIS